jgi:hypothetical protein
VTAEDISAAVKRAATNLWYPLYRAIPIDWVDTHMLQIEGAFTSALSCYSEMHIHNIGCWIRETFKEHVSEELYRFSDGKHQKLIKLSKYNGT